MTVAFVTAPVEKHDEMQNRSEIFLTEKTEILLHCHLHMIRIWEREYYIIGYS